MKLFAPTLLLTLTAMAVPAVSYAACTGNPLNQTELGNLLGGNTVCGRPGPSYPGGASSSDRWQELHRAGGQLWDYKLGPLPGGGVDPIKQVGTWAISGAGTNTTIVHSYGSTSFTWQVYGPNVNVPGTSIYSFCTVASTPDEHVVAVVLLNETPCGTSYPAAGATNRATSSRQQSLKSAPAPALPGGKTK